VEHNARTVRLRGALRDGQGAAEERAGCFPGMHDALLDDYEGIIRVRRAFGPHAAQLPFMSMARTNPGLQFELKTADLTRQLFTEHD
jgi:hypothetical protein